MWYKKGFWRHCDAERWVWKSWEGESVVYDRGSGDSHYLSDIPCHLVSALRKGVLSGEEMESLCKGWNSDSGTPNITSYLHSLLVDLTRIGLIEQVRS